MTGPLHHSSQVHEIIVDHLCCYQYLNYEHGSATLLLLNPAMLPDIPSPGLRANIWSVLEWFNAGLNMSV